MAIKANLTTAQLKTLDYKVAQKYIVNLPEAKKQKLFSDLDSDYICLSSKLNGYNNRIFGSLINKHEYFNIMSGIKKLEILMSYCFTY